MKQKDLFIYRTGILNLFSAAFLFWKAYIQGFCLPAYFVIGMNIIYLPLLLILKRKAFAWWNLFYGIGIIYIIAFEKTFLYNNYTALFIFSVVIVCKPKLKNAISLVYFIAVTIAFLINDEAIYCYLIHITRCIWILYVLSTLVKEKYIKKQLILTHDEEAIIKQLAEGKLQKEISGYSKNTITQKIQDACDRNNIQNKYILITLYNMGAGTNPTE